jgi:hypothetical protein
MEWRVNEDQQTTAASHQLTDLQTNNSLSMEESAFAVAGF